MKRLSIIVAVLGLAACAAQVESSPKMAITDLHNPAGEHVGVATFVEGADGVRIAVNLHNMPPGVHALHIHAAASCEKPDFKSAKGHFNPYEKKHGLKNPCGPHAGDLFNILIADDGTGAVIATAALVTMGGGKNSLFRDGGTALMIHEGPDDYVSDPAGAAGPRVACGVIRSLE
jgi:Cu-Zn family superoxide dismutase